MGIRFAVLTPLFTLIPLGVIIAFVAWGILWLRRKRDHDELLLSILTEIRDSMGEVGRLTDTALQRRKR